MILDKRFCLSVCAGLCSLFSTGILAITLPIGEGYCSALQVICEDGTYTIGKCMPSDGFIKKCYFLDPPGFSDISRQEWARTFCQDHGGVAHVEQPKFHSSMDLILVISTLREFNKPLSDAILQAWRASKGPQDAQKIYDMYIQGMLGAYYTPLAPRDID